LSKKVPLDDDVYEALQQRAEPFVDTPNSVLRRILGLDDNRPQEPGGAEGGTHQRAYRLPIAASLVRRGGTARVRVVLADIEEQMGSQLDSHDRGLTKSGETRWRNRVQWARLEMVHEGLLEKASDRGTWTITPAGRDFLRREGR
jgi:Mrr N-terminal domain